MHLFICALTKSSVLIRLGVELFEQFYVLGEFDLLRGDRCNFIHSIPFGSFHSFGRLCGGLNNQSGVATQQSSFRLCQEAFEAVEERLSAFRDPSNAKKSVRSEGQPGGERE
eukprot:scaffold12821_cov45-Cyclotella_meneghiniana.AAC.1